MNAMLTNTAIKQGKVAIDHAKPFMPEHLTPLFHTPLYAKLTTKQRLTYNQLFGCYSQEQILFFETTLGQWLPEGLRKLGLPKKLAILVDDLEAEEWAHARMFSQLNKLAFPDLYANGDLHFIRFSKRHQRVLKAMASRPQFFPYLAWLGMLLEERSIGMAHEYALQANELEPNFAGIQSAHVADEAEHLQSGKLIFEFLWEHCSSSVLRWNVRVFGWMIKEFFSVPKRAGVAVVERLLGCHPEIDIPLASFRQAMHDLAHDEDFLETCYNRTNVPQSFALFDQYPAFSVLQRYLKTYVPA